MEIVMTVPAFGSVLGRNLRGCMLSCSVTEVLAVSQLNEQQHGEVGGKDGLMDISDEKLKWREAHVPL